MNASSSVQALGDARYVLRPTTLYTAVDTTVSPDPTVGPWLTENLVPKLQSVGGRVEWLGPYFLAFTAGQTGLPTDGLRINTRTGETHVLYRVVVDGRAYRSVIRGQVSDISLTRGSSGVTFSFSGEHVDSPPHPSLPQHVADGQFTFTETLTLDSY